MEIWPNFFIVGASKAGTTSLYSYLNNTPGVYMSTMKEPRFFNSDYYDEIAPYRITDKKEYLKLFRDVKDECAIGEASPSYLADPESAKLIHQVVPEARIIIILRDPVERAFSMYLMNELKGRMKQSFHEVITKKLEHRTKSVPEYDYLDSKLYSPHVKRYLTVFGVKQVKVLMFEEFFKEPKKNMKQVLEFLHVDSESTDIVGTNFNPYGVPRLRIFENLLKSKTFTGWIVKIIPQNLQWKIKENIIYKKEKKPKIPDEDRLILQNFYRDDARDLQALLNRKLPWDWVDKIS